MFMKMEFYGICLKDQIKKAKNLKDVLNSFRYAKEEADAKYISTFNVVEDKETIMHSIGLYERMTTEQIEDLRQDFWAEASDNNQKMKDFEERLSKLEKKVKDNELVDEITKIINEKLI